MLRPQIRRDLFLFHLACLVITSLGWTSVGSAQSRSFQTLRQLESIGLTTAWQSQLAVGAADREAFVSMHVSPQRVRKIYVSCGPDEDERAFAAELVEAWGGDRAVSADGKVGWDGLAGALLRQDRRQPARRRGQVRQARISGYWLSNNRLFTRKNGTREMTIASTS